MRELISLCGRLSVGIMIGIVSGSQINPVSAGQDRDSATLKATLEPQGDNKSPFRCEALLSVGPVNVCVGGTFTVVCEVRGGREPANLYNAFLSERYKLPANIIITSVDGKFRQELLRPVDGGPEKGDARCWTYVRPGRTLGRELAIRIGKLTDLESADSRIRAIDLEPGQYYVQAIYNHWIVANWLNNPGRARSAPIGSAGDEPRPWVSSMSMDGPLAISKPVKLVVTQPRPATPELPARNCPLDLELTRLDRAESVRPFEASVQIRMTNHSIDTIDLFNPFLDRRLFFQRKVVDLAVMREDGTFVGNVLVQREMEF